MDPKLIVDQLNRKAHRGCTSHKLVEAPDGPQVRGGKHSPEGLTQEEWEAIAFYVPPSQKLSSGGEPIRQAERFSYRGLRCEVAFNPARHRYEGRHLDNTPSCFWYEAEPANTANEAKKNVERLVDGWHRNQNYQANLVHHS